MQIDGNALRRIRERAGLTQRMLAEQAGVSPTYISGLETGYRTGTAPPRAKKLAEALSVDIVALEAEREPA